MAALVWVAGTEWAVGAGHVDWHRYRGPDHNGISKETGWSAVWQKEGPKQLWKANVGIGFSSMTVADGRVYTMGNKGDKDTVYCLNSQSGAIVWQHTYDCPLDPKYYEGGTSSTPTVDARQVYTFSRRGHLFCLDAAKGAVVWQKNLVTDLGLKIPEWGFAGSPLVDGDLLILNAGERGVAVNKQTGALVWKSSEEASGYATPVPMSPAGKRVVAVFGAKGIFGLEPSNGKVAWSHDWETSYDVNAADPLASGDEVFISSGYNRGGALLKISPTGKPKVLWENKHMRNQLNSCVLLDGHLYGFDGNVGKEGTLRCLEWSSGGVKWTQKGLGTGSLMAASGRLIILSEMGELVVAEASPAGFKAVSRAQVLGGTCWTVPVLAGGKLLCRNSKGELVCLDVSGQVTARR